MNWIDQMLQQAWRSCPRGGVAPFVIYPSSGCGTDQQGLKHQLIDMAQRERAAVERSFVQWASTARWPRSTRCSGWLVRQILDAAQSAGAPLSKSLALLCVHDSSAHRADVLQALCSAWYAQDLLEWADLEAAQEYEAYRQSQWDC